MLKDLRENLMFRRLRGTMGKGRFKTKQDDHVPLIIIGGGVDSGFFPSIGDQNWLFWKQSSIYLYEKINLVCINLKYY